MKWRIHGITIQRMSTTQYNRIIYCWHFLSTVLSIESYHPIITFFIRPFLSLPFPNSLFLHLPNKFAVQFLTRILALSARNVHLKTLSPKNRDQYTTAAVGRETSVALFQRRLCSRSSPRDRGLYGTPLPSVSSIH